MVPSDELPDARDGLTRSERTALRDVGSSAEWQKPAERFGLGPFPRDAQPWEDPCPNPVYDAAIGLAREWIQAHPLLDLDGNGGSIDGDPHSNACWILLRRSAVGQALFETPSKGDSALLAAFPTLLVNGSREGLARFMPHNLREVAAALAARLADPTLDLDGVMQHLPGPDFPTGGILLDGPEVRDTYAIGRGEFRIRARTVLGDDDRGRATVTVTEMPYGVLRGGEDGVFSEIAQMAGERLLPVGDLQDRSDRHGVGLVIQGRSDVNAEQLRRQLFATTRLHHTLEVRMLAEVDGTPRTLPLLAALDLHLETRRSYHRAAGVADGRIGDAIRAELAELVERFGRDRRTEIVAAN